MRVLVVEDDDKIASFVVKGLRQSGFAADHAGDGEAALGCCQDVDYDAIILDIMLPKTDGLSVLRHIRAEKRLVPVIQSSWRTLNLNRKSHVVLVGQEPGGFRQIICPSLDLI